MKNHSPNFAAISLLRSVLKIAVTSLFCIFYTFSLYAQYPDTPPSLDYYNGEQAYIPRGSVFDTVMVSVNFQDTSIWATEQKHFLLGHQWGSAPRTINKRFHMNFFNEKFNYQSFLDYSTKTAARTLSGTQYISVQHDYMTNDAMALCMQWDPETPLEQYYERWTPAVGDTTGAIFGFKYKNGGTITGNHYTVNTIGKPSTGILILSDIEHYFDMRAPYGTSYDNTMYFAINLRRADTALQSASGDSIILKIKIPIKFFDNTLQTYIKRPMWFDSVLSNTANTVQATIQYHNRGRYMDTKLVSITPKDSVLIIRRSMLPDFSDTCDVTLSAFFSSVPTPDDNENPPFPYIFQAIPETGQIDSFDIRVEYFPNCNIKINWLRLETINARKLFRGQLDTMIAGYMTKDIKNIIDQFQDSVPSSRLWRIYPVDEPKPSQNRFMRYMTALFKGYVHSEGGGTAQYSHCVGEPNMWFGVPQLNYAGSPTPYYPYAITRMLADNVFDTNYYAAHGNKYFNLGYQYGSRPCLYDRANTRSNERWNHYDSLHGGNYYGNSYEMRTRMANGYECFQNPAPAPATPWIATPKSWNSAPYDTRFYRMLSYPQEPSILLRLEGQLYGNYYLHPDMLYKKPWHSYVVFHGNFKGQYIPSSTIKYARINNQRPHSGEEVRISLWYGMVLGSKGLLYDRFYTVPTLVDIDTAEYYHSLGNDYYWNLMQGAHDTHYGCMDSPPFAGFTTTQLDSENPALADALINSDAAGTDFLRENDKTNIDDYIDFDSVSVVLGVPKSRIYLGRKSIRKEVRKIHDWISTVGDTLMNLRLVGWYGKGHREIKSALYNDTSVFTNFLSFDTNRLQTIPIVRNTIKDGWDSTFCDITLLRQKDTTNIPMSKEFYVGVVNRRTNPLIRNSHTSNELAFFTTSEFDSLTTGSDTTWQGERYKQGGSRILKVPFKYYSSQSPYTLLRVTELGAHDQYLDSVYPYRNNAQLYHKVDTVIAQDGTLSLKLLPGEGKMFRVKVIPSDTSINGILAHSNQRKLISFPIPIPIENDSVITGWGLSPDSVRFYLCYFRPVSDSNKRTVVCYRRSEVAAFNTPSANVQWGNEIILSDSYIHPTRTIENDTCAYPSILVQYDSNTATVHTFVVYGCKGYMPIPPPGGQERFQRIVQSYIVYPSPVIDTPTIYSRVAVDSVYTDDLAEYGTPMIGGSTDGVHDGAFYTWADRKRGIGIGWKPETFSYLLGKKYIRFHEDTSECFSTWKAQHPSLSTYTPSRQQGKDCIVAWQENYSCDDNRTEIFTTRLRGLVSGMGQLGITNFLGSDFENAGSYGYFNADSSIYCLSNNKPPLKDTVRLGNTFVMPWRELSLRDTCSVVPLSAASRIRMDAFVWQQQRPTFIFPNTPYTRLLLGGLIHPDTLIGGTVTPIRTSVLTKTILSHYPLGDLYFPTISQGTANNVSDSYSLNAEGCLNSSNTSLVINAIETNELFGGSFAPHYIHQELSHTPFAYVAPQKDIAGTKFGSYIHLAGIPFAHDPETRWEHRRVYNHRPNYYAPTALPQILASAHYFYKQGDDVVKRTYLGWNDADGSISVTLPEINSIPLQWNVRSDRRSPYMIASDTLCTEWFRINDLTSMKQWIKTEGWDALQVYIQKKGEEPQRLPLSIRKSADGRGTKHQTDFMNGENEEYRLLFSRGTETAYLERTIITEPDNDGLEKATIQTIDLQQLPKGNTELSIYPNPASDEITVTWKGGKATVQLLDMKGNVLITHTIQSILTLPTEELTNGLYMIRLQQGINSITKSFMVLK